MKTEDKVLLLCACVNLTDDNRQQLIGYLKGEIDFDYLVAAAGRGQILPLLYHHLKRFNERVPEDVLARLKGGYLNNLARSLKIFKEYTKLVALLNSEGIDVVPLKGPVVAEVVYGDMALRATSDMDVLVKEEDLDRARDLVIKDGYKERGADKDYNLKYARKYQHHLEFTKNVYLELHWNIGRFRIYRFHPQVLWEDVAVYNVQGQPIKFLSPTANLIQRFYRVLEDPFLKGLVDISELLKRFYGEIDWGDLYRKMGYGNMRNATFYFAKRAHEIIGAPVNLKGLNSRPTFRRLVADMFFGPEKMINNRSMALRRLVILLLMDNMKDVFSVLQQYILPSAEYKKAFKEHF